jgi:hemin uptake protein HemP
MATQPQPTLPAATPPVPAQPIVREEVHRISSDVLLAGAQEVQIEHHGALYRLRQTSLGKLILTK